ncbi:MAG TPA: hypothetical protein DGG95_00030 [Cytophagales bacterium]|jgi:choline dehydrogenase-like flavoprotein|nr:hypothetical protein [Cytophagales bacterium]
MHIDARNLPDHSIIEGDVCIVGAGAAGISMSLDWMKNPKQKVILLESGGFEFEDRIQDMYKGKTTGQKYYPMRSNRLSFFGGTTNHWAGMCSPFDDIDFEKRDWVPNSGWPIVKKDLDPFYAKANEVLKLGPYDYTLEFWQKQKPNMNPFPLDSNIVWHKMWQLSPVNGFTGGLAKVYKEPVVKSKNIHLYTYATMVDVKATEDVSSISELVVKNYAGKTHIVRAKYFILAGGAIQNARMLLAANSQAKNGLGNDNDLVGRYFMEHLEIDTAELWLLKPFPTDLFSWNGTWCELAIHPKVQQANKILNGTAGPQPLTYIRNTKPRIDLWKSENWKKNVDDMFGNWDEAAKKAEKENIGSISRAYSFQTRMEQSPNPDSRVTIGQEKDELGVPLANLNWQLTDLDKRSLRKINQIIGHQVGVAGFARLKLHESLRDENDNSWPAGTNGGWHHMGTTRMSDDPKNGVVDKNCKVHGISNLYVAGSGCYTTSAAPNPTLTLVALSLRLSSHIQDRLNQSA